MYANRVKTRSQITVSAEDTLSPREVALTNQHLLKVLPKNPGAEIGAYVVPKKNGDVFRRRLVVSSVPKRPDINPDLPDFQDTQYTDLPWVGHATFLDAHRAFRSKYYLTVVAEVVREFDGFLYSLTIEVPDRVYEPLTLRIVDVPQIDKSATYYDLVIRKDLDDETLAKNFSNAPQVPETFIKDMTALGYTLENGIFSHPAFPSFEHRIKCELWGKINRIHHLREVK